ncbi:MAG TPA: ArsB/NhaD family transporter [Candidatus Dormibacteraeota bacterium]|nr:ArsB/NhaD family transporter [Candidatus Dormibacteraeota bacterium]
MHLVLVSVVFGITLFMIVVRPWRISEAWSAGGGAAALVLTGAISPTSAVISVIAEWNLFLFFFGLMLTAAVADMARFFDWAAALAARAAGGSGRRLLLTVLFLGALITTFLSNDAAAIMLTPVVYGVVTRLRLRVVPYLFAIAFMANAASMTLPISNPINVLTGDKLGASLGVYADHLLAASIASITITAACFMAIFWRAVDHRFDFDWRTATSGAAADRGFFLPVVLGLAALAAAYIAGSALLWPLGVVATIGGIGLMGFAAIRHRVSRDVVRAHVSPTLFVYLASLFVLVRAAQEVGITGALVAGATGHAGSAASAAISGLVGSAVLSNLANNLPSQLLFVSGALSGGVSAGLRVPFLFGALAGADLGPNLTPVGALSTMLWLLIVRRRGIEVSSWDFLRLGVVIAPATLIVAGILIAVSFR